MHHVVRGRFSPDLNIDKHFSNLLAMPESTAGILEFGLYFKQLSTYFEFFDQSQFLVFIYEHEFSTNPGLMVAQILDFIGANSKVTDFSKIAPKNLGIKSSFSAHLGAQLSCFLKEDGTRMKFGGYIQYFCYLLEHILNLKPMKIENDTIEALKAYYERDSKSLAKMLKLNAPIW